VIAATTRALVARLAELLAREHGALADFLATLADFDQQRRWEELGYANLYDFLVRELGMSKGTAFYRKVAVALVQRYPEVLEPLRDGRLCITVVHALSKAITPGNRAEVLPRFFHVSKQGAKVIAAKIAPALEVPRREIVTTTRTTAALDFGHVPNRSGSDAAVAAPNDPGRGERWNAIASSPARSPPRSGARCGSATSGDASGRWKEAGSAARSSAWSWTTFEASNPASP
jgi:hypothetical protein